MSEDTTTDEAGSNVAEEEPAQEECTAYTHVSSGNGKTYYLCKSPTGMHFFANKPGANAVDAFPDGHHIVENEKNGFPYCKKKKD